MHSCAWLAPASARTAKRLVVPRRSRAPTSRTTPELRRVRQGLPGIAGVFERTMRADLRRPHELLAAPAWTRLATRSIAVPRARTARPSTRRAPPGCARAIREEPQYGCTGSLTPCSVPRAAPPVSVSTRPKTRATAARAGPSVPAALAWPGPAPAPQQGSRRAGALAAARSAATSPPIRSTAFAAATCAPRVRSSTAYRRQVSARQAAVSCKRARAAPGWPSASKASGMAAFPPQVPARRWSRHRPKPGGFCTDPMTDPNNCGTCNTKCNPTFSGLHRSTRVVCRRRVRRFRFEVISSSDLGGSHRRSSSSVTMDDRRWDHRPKLNVAGRSRRIRA